MKNIDLLKKEILQKFSEVNSLEKNHHNIILKHNEYIQQGGIFASIFQELTSTLEKCLDSGSK